MSKFNEKINVDSLQLYLTKGAILHPITYDQFVSRLIELEHKGKVALLPQTRLESYSRKIAAKIANG